MSTIVLDTNFLMIPAVLKVDIFEELVRMTGVQEFSIVDKSLDELRHLSTGKFGQDAKIALQLTEKKIEDGQIKVLKSITNGSVDDNIVEMADEDFIVATQDKELKKRVLEKGARLIILRQKKYLKLV